MAKFNPRQFLAQAGNGKTTPTCPKQQFLFSKGDTANAVFYVQIWEGRHAGGVIPKISQLAPRIAADRAWSTSSLRHHSFQPSEQV
jgi:hypothetical protein